MTQWQQELAEAVDFMKSKEYQEMIEDLK